MIFKAVHAGEGSPNEGATLPFVEAPFRMTVLIPTDAFVKHTVEWWEEFVLGVVNEASERVSERINEAIQEAGE